MGKGTKRAVRGVTGKVTRRGILSSTPITVGRGKCVSHKIKPRTRVLRRRSDLARAKRRLDEGLQVDLSSSSEEDTCKKVAEFDSIGCENVAEFDSTGSSLRGAILSGVLSDGNTTDWERPVRDSTTCDERACPAKYVDSSPQDAPSIERACPAKYVDYGPTVESSSTKIKRPVLLNIQMIAVQSFRRQRSNGLSC